MRTTGLVASLCRLSRREVEGLPAKLIDGDFLWGEFNRVEREGELLATLMVGGFDGAGFEGLPERDELEPAERCDAERDAFKLGCR